MLRIKKDKFIVYNYTPNKISDLDLFGYVYKTIQLGKISNDDTEYCYVTTFGKEDVNVVSMRKTKYGYRVAVYNENEIKKLKELEKVSEGENE